jgi:hypothetical protein
MCTIDRSPKNCVLISLPQVNKLVRVTLDNVDPGKLWAPKILTSRRLLAPHPPVLNLQKISEARLISTSI